MFGVLMRPTNLVFVFIDNTNVCKESKKTVVQSEHVSMENVHIHIDMVDFSSLFWMDGNWVIARSTIF
jgi:hypothetical protein